MVELAIGSIVYLFDTNRRVYDKSSNNVGPIYREHFRPLKITGETSRSWIVDHYRPIKASKKALAETGRDGNIFASLEEVERDCWLNDHSHKVARLVDRCRDYDKIRAIAKIVGYKAGDDE